MPKLSSQQRALEAIALFEKHGREVKSVTLLKHGEVKIDFFSSADDEGHMTALDQLFARKAAEREARNSLDNKDFKIPANRTEKKPPRGSRQALHDRLAKK